MNDELTADSANEPMTTTPTPTGIDKLNEASAQIKLGQSPTVTVRQLLDWFGYSRRGHRVIREISSALNDAGLLTDPDFEYAWMDGPVTLRMVGASPPALATTSTTTTSGPLPESAVSITEVTDTQPVPSKAYADPTFRVGKLDFANHPPVCVHPDSSVSEALTVMMQHDFSQLPVMTNERDIRGVISWKSLAIRQGLGGPCNTVRDCMDSPAAVVDEDTSLFRVIDSVVEYGCVFVRDKTRKISGIVTASDLSETFHQLGRPFLVLGEIENLIRGLLDGKFTCEELHQVRNPGDGARPVEDIADLTFGEYVRLIQEPARWKKVGLNIDRAVFVKGLESVNRIRNDVMHFDPEGITDTEMDELRKMARFLQNLRAAGRTAGVASA